MKLRVFQKYGAVALIISWFLTGWPLVWQSPRIPPKIQEVSAATTPAYRSSGVFKAGTPGITVLYPVDMVANDVCLLVVETENEAITLNAANGFAEISAYSPQSAGTANVSPASRLAVYWKRTVGSDIDPSILKSGDHTTGQIHCFSGVTTSGDPWDTGAGGNDSAANDTSGVIPGATTNEDNTLVVLINSSSGDNNSTAEFSGWANSDLASLTERTDNTNKAGKGGGHGMATGEKASAGAYGNTTVTLANTSYKGAISLALKGVGNNPPSLTVSQPDGVSDTVVVGQSYNITYDLSDTEDTATVDFYYDDNSSGLDGSAITGCQDQAEGTGATCSWDTTGMTPGDYYVYGIATDGVNSDVDDYSPGVITIQAVVYSVAIAPGGTIEYGLVGGGVSKSTIDVAASQTATNDGNITTQLNIKSTNATGGTQWTIGSSAGTNIFVHEFSTNNGGDYTKFIAADSYQTLAVGVGVTAVEDLDLRITAPTDSDAQQKTITVTVQAAP